MNCKNPTKTSSTLFNEIWFVSSNEFSIRIDAAIITPNIKRKIFFDRTWFSFNGLSMISGQNHENILRHVFNGFIFRWFFFGILIDCTEQIDRWKERRKTLNVDDNTNWTRWNLNPRSIRIDEHSTCAFKVLLKTITTIQSNQLFNNFKLWFNYSFIMEIP